MLVNCLRQFLGSSEQLFLNPQLALSINGDTYAKKPTIIPDGRLDPARENFERTKRL